ncbi:MAG: patatin-like phospholipase family protein [Calothrix sp. C42_A2020_038]|nr:patatin-like phospholipase family protein [Calothrix sp. C42_A2020_038]
MPFNILSLDGGGIRGIVAAKMLTIIEQEIKQPLHEYFQLIAGTSTGSILAAAIASGRRSEEIVDLYKQKSSIIFPYKSRFSIQRLPLIFKHGISAPKYSDTGLINILQGVFGDTTLFDIASPLLLIISFDTIERSPIFFKSWRQDKSYGNVPLWEVCVCSASAPTYFPAHKLDKRINGTAQGGYSEVIILDDNASSVDNIYNNMQIRIIDGTGSLQTRTIRKYSGSSHQATIYPSWDTIPDKTSVYSIKSIYSAIDGGVAANNPSSCAVAEALRLGYAIEDIRILSIGTGERTRVIPFEKAQHWGLIQWAQPLIGVLFDGSSEIYQYITKQIAHQRILRLQFKLDRELTGKRLSDDIDDVSPENISNLLEAAQVYMQQPHIQTSLQKFFKE